MTLGYIWIAKHWIRDHDSTLSYRIAHDGLVFCGQQHLDKTRSMFGQQDSLTGSFSVFFNSTAQRNLILHLTMIRLWFVCAKIRWSRSTLVHETVCLFEAVQHNRCCGNDLQWSISVDTIICKKHSCPCDCVLVRGRPAQPMFRKWLEMEHISRHDNLLIFWVT